MARGSERGGNSPGALKTAPVLPRSGRLAHRERSFDFVIAATLACEGGFRARADGIANTRRVGTGDGWRVLGELGWRKFGPKTKRPRLKESRDARPNSPPPSAAQEPAYVGTGEMGMALMGYPHYRGLDRSNQSNQ